MLTNDKTGLKIFSNTIRIDKDLPKYKVVESELSKDMNIADKVSLQTLISDAAGSRSLNLLINKSQFDKLKKRGLEFSEPNFIRIQGDEDGSPISSNNSNSKGIFNWISRKIQKYKNTPEPAAPEEKYELDILEFFSHVKGVANKENVYTDRLSNYVKLIGLSEASGQTALKEKLLADLIINKYESILYANDIYKVVTEEQMVEFVKKTEKGLSLTYIANYINFIPIEVIDKKCEVDKLEIFDNYCILHYDPDKKSFADTIAEKEEKERKKRDPILFGLIAGSNKLYFIADWIDEINNDDLTFETIVDKLGESELNKSSLKNIISENELSAKYK